MSVYLVTYLNANNHNHIDARINEIDSNNRYRVQNNAGWLVDYTGTSRQLFDVLCNEGTSERPRYRESVIITSTDSCFGFADGTMWDWLKAHSGN